MKGSDKDKGGDSVTVHGNDRKLKDDEALIEKLNVSNSEEFTVDYSDMDTGWAWIVLLSSFGTFCLLGSALYAVGIIHSTLLDRYQQSLSLTSWAGALHTALVSLAG